MSKKNTLQAGTSPFAHLLGGVAALAGCPFGKRAEDDTPPGEEGPNDPDEVIDDNDLPDEGEGKRGKKGKRAEDDENDPDAEDDDDVDPDAEEPEDEKEAKAFRAGVACANCRGAAIFGSKAATGRPDLAAQLVYGTRMSSKEAIGVLATAGQPATATIRGRSLDDRMAARVEPRPGADGAAGRGNKPTLAERIQATKKRLAGAK